MMLNRRWPSATHPSSQPPEPSGPRHRRSAVIRPTAAVSAGTPSKRTSPLMPHMTRTPFVGPRHDLVRGWSDGGAADGSKVINRARKDLELSAGAARADAYPPLVARNTVEMKGRPGDPPNDVRPLAVAMSWRDPVR